MGKHRYPAVKDRRDASPTGKPVSLRKDSASCVGVEAKTWGDSNSIRGRVKMIRQYSAKCRQLVGFGLFQGVRVVLGARNFIG